MNPTEKEMPTFEVVYAFTSKTTEYFIQKHARWIPREQKEEIMQDAYLRAAEAYKKLDPEKGWKSFIQLHCRGAVLDYLKLGNGSIEDGTASEDVFDGLQYRVNIQSETDGRYLQVEEIAALSGIYTDPDESDRTLNINWDLLSRMAGIDDDLHIVAKRLLGFTQEEIAYQFSLAPGCKISRERVGQRSYEFFARLENPRLGLNAWVNQCIFALGISDFYSDRKKDHRIGWNLSPLNLRDEESFKIAKSKPQLALFDFSTHLEQASELKSNLKVRPIRGDSPSEGSNASQLDFLEDSDVDPECVYSQRFAM